MRHLLMISIFITKSVETFFLISYEKFKFILFSFNLTENLQNYNI